MLIVFCAVLIGMSKTGVPGVSMIVVPTLALIFGGKQSTGVLLPILIMADVFLVNDEQFKRIIAITVFVSVALMIWKDYYYKKVFTPDKWWFAALMGIVGGFATMIGNVAGPILAIYLLAMHLNKKSFIGTTAWFFFIINLTKFPLQVLVWKNININTLTVDILVLPAIAFGAWLGVFFVKLIPEKAYKWFVIVITVLSAFLILI